MKKKIYEFLGQKQAVFFDDDRETEIEEIFKKVCENASPSLMMTLAPIPASDYIKQFVSDLDGIAITLPIVEGKISEAMEYVDFPICSKEEFVTTLAEGTRTSRAGHNFIESFLYALKETKKELEYKKTNNSISEEDKQKINSIISLLREPIEKEFDDKLQFLDDNYLEDKQKFPDIEDELALEYEMKKIDILTDKNEFLEEDSQKRTQKREELSSKLLEAKRKLYELRIHKYGESYKDYYDEDEIAQLYPELVQGIPEQNGSNPRISEPTTLIPEENIPEPPSSDPKTKRTITGRISKVLSSLRRKINKEQTDQQMENPQNTTAQSGTEFQDTARDVAESSATIEDITLDSSNSTVSTKSEKNTIDINEKAEQLGISTEILEKYHNMSNDELLQISRSNLGKDGIENVRAVKAILKERIEKIKHEQLQHELDEVENLQNELRQLAGQDIGEAFINLLEDDRAVQIVDRDLSETKEKSIK